MSIVSPPAITALPTPPDPNDRATFNARAYPWSVAQQTFGTQVGAVAANVFANATDAATSAASSANSATAATTNGAAQVALATTQANAAAASAALATTNGATQVALAATQAGIAAIRGHARSAPNRAIADRYRNGDGAKRCHFRQGNRLQRRPA